MNRFFTKLVGGKPQIRKSKRDFKPALEALEDRLVPAGVTDMTALAQQMITAPDSKTIVSTPDAPIHLYLNFDGYQDDQHAVVPYYGSYDQINDIVFRVSEIFSPFNVVVSRRDGFSNYDDANGSTTVFIGDDTHNNVTNADGSVTNLIKSRTPRGYSDHPGEYLGDQHFLHSNAFNLAFVDPVGNDGGQWSFSGTEQIVRGIAHEAGHTFGLAHVLTKTDDNLAGEPEIMSYDTEHQYFADETFDITNANFNSNDDGTVPVYDGTPLLTQNSYTYLEQILGDRPSDGAHHVLQEELAVAPGHSPNWTNYNWGTNSVKTGTIDREGDYDVYEAHMFQDWNVSIELTPTAGSDLRPTLLIYKDGELLDYPYARVNAAGQQEVALGLHLEAKFNYAFVVFGANGTSTGGYRLTSQGTLVNIDLGETAVIPGQDLADELRPHLSPVLSVAADVGGVASGPNGGSVLETGMVGDAASSVLPADGGAPVDAGVPPDPALIVAAPIDVGSSLEVGELAQVDPTLPPANGDPLFDEGMLAAIDPVLSVTPPTDGGLAAQIDPVSTVAPVADGILTMDVGGVGAEAVSASDSSPSEAVVTAVDPVAMPAGDSSLATAVTPQDDPASSSTPAVVSQVPPISPVTVPQPAVNHSALNTFFSSPLWSTSLRTRVF
jgi:hypothetical protein